MSELRVHTEWETKEYNAPLVADVAHDRGLNMVEADAHHLQLDLDKPRTAEQEAALDILMRDTDLVEALLTTVSQHGKQHLYVRLSRALDLKTRVMLQAILGSDPRRELLSAMREGVRDPELVLFETDAEYPLVLSFLGREQELAEWKRNREAA
jgi:hypothetical protein